MRAGFVAVMAVVVFGCSKEAPPPPAVKTAPTAPASRALEVVWDGGKPSGEAIKVRVVSLIGKDAEHRAVDVWTVDAKTQRWLRLVKALPYGALSEPLQVPKIFGGARLFFLAPDEKPGDPYKLVNASADVSWPAESPHANGPFTMIVRDEHDGLTSQVVNDAETLAATSDRARVQVRSVLAWPGVPALELSLGEGQCLEPNRILNEALAEVPPGAVTPVLHDASAADHCQGPKLASGAEVTLAAGDVLVLVLGGRSDKDALLVPVKLSR